MISIGVIGFGYWGPNLVRNFHATDGVVLKMVCDLSPERLKEAGKRSPGTQLVDNPRKLIESTDIDAVVIATPVATHFELGMAALQAGKHVLIEKPLTATAEEARRLVDEAEARKLVLMVDHTFVYSGAVRKISQLLHEGTLGRILYYDSIRINLGLFQHDVDVLADLAVHDLSILDYLLDEEPDWVSAVGTSHFPHTPINTAFATFQYPSGVIAHINVNWLAPVKIRRTVIGGSNQMLVFDDLEPDEKIKIYDKGVTWNTDTKQIYSMRAGYRTGDMRSPQIDTTEALSLVAREFVRAIESGEQPLTHGQMGLRIVRMLAGASLSMQRNGNPVLMTAI